MTDPRDPRDYIQRCIDPSFTMRCLRCHREVFFPSHLAFGPCPHCGSHGFGGLQSNHPDSADQREAHAAAAGE